MEPHSPYFPGFRRGIKVGLLKTYVSLFANAIHSDNDNYNGSFPNWIQQHLKALYTQCNKELDSVLSNWIESYQDDATIVVAGDHGEEFDHGVITHARLYDETVKVPLLTNRNLGFQPANNLTRQIDIAPAISEYLDIEQPDSWEGDSSAEGDAPQLMIGSLELYNQFWLGVRTENWKLIKPYHVNQGFGETEVYNLAQDPAEENSLPESAAPEELLERLASFLEREHLKEELTENYGFVGGVDSSVEARLQELGYTD
jgi:arylsulfatase A-like enzyme